MKRSKGTFRTWIGVISITFLFLSTAVWGAIVEPTESSAYRALRADAVKNWYVYADTDVDYEGILYPGDKRVGEFHNWWTVVSSGTNNMAIKNTYSSRVNTSPQNFATGSAVNNLYLPRKNRSLQFYMSYSQMDNNTEAAYRTWGNPSGHTGYGDFMADRHKDTDGWVWGWVLGDYDNTQAKGTTAADLGMDIFVHNGKEQNPGSTGWVSDPQVTASNHMDDLAMDAAGNRVPPKWNENTGEYDYAVNHSYYTYYKTNFKPGMNTTDFENVIGPSMEVAEKSPEGDDVTNNSIWFDRTPKAVKNDIPGVTYEYQDAFQVRHEKYANESVGGSLGGMSGYDEYDPEDPYGTYADQQVIRIDLDQDALAQLDEVVIYDFGLKGSLSQVNPSKILFGVRVTGTGFLQLFYDDNGNGVFDTVDFDMPENRIYIARVDMAPEPLSLTMLGLSGLGLLKIHSRRKRA